MTGHTVILVGERQRAYARKLVDQAPPGYVVTVAEPKYTDDQRKLIWAVLTELSKARPYGRRHTPAKWKLLVMNACGYECQFMEGLNGEIFPVGLSLTQLTKAQASKLIEWIYAYAAEAGVELSRIAQERNDT